MIYRVETPVEEQGSPTALRRRDRAGKVCEH